jgi:hypothetical protein
MVATRFMPSTRVISTKAVPYWRWPFSPQKKAAIRFLIRRSFNGYQVQASYVVTGESRGYRNSVFRGVSPHDQSLGRGGSGGSL